MQVFRLVRSYFGKSGWLSIMLTIVGTSTALVTPCSPIAFITGSASNFGSIAWVPPASVMYQSALAPAKWKKPAT